MAHTMEHFYQKIPLMIHPPEIEYLRGIVDEAPPGSTLVELGTNVGYACAFLLVEALNSGKNLRLVTIDNWSNNWHVSNAKADFLRVFQEHGALEKVRTIEADSARAAELFDSRSVWFVFVDADHSEGGCRRDIDAWSPKIARGGVLAGHDFGGQYGVTAAVMGIFGRGNFRHIQPSVWEKRFPA